MGTTSARSRYVRDAWRRGFEDGLPDMAAGLLLANIQLGGFLDHLGLAVGWRIGIPIATMLAILGGVSAAKRRWSTPRLGEFRIEQSRRRRLWPVMLTSVGVTIGLVVFTMGAQAGWFPDGVPTVLIILGVFALKAIVLLSLAAWYFGVLRLHLYGWLVAWAIAGSELLIRGTGLSMPLCYLCGFGLSSAIMIGVGCVQFARFVRRYPRHDVETQG